MLNKLSFNLAKELNESETRNFKIKKKVFMESNGVKVKNLTENLKLVKISFECPECGYSWTQDFKDYFEDEDDLENVFEYSDIRCPECDYKCQGESYEIIEEGENTFKYSFTPDEIKKILLDNYHDGEGFESEADLEQYLDEELNNIKRIESESNISMISQPGNDSFPGFKYGKVRTVLKDGRAFISEENGLSLMSAVELSVSKLEESNLTEGQDTHSILSKVFAQYPDIDDEDEEYLNGLPYDELVIELKNRGWDDLLEAASMNSKSKEDRLASLKMQLEKDGAQLADDEKKAIEEEIAQLESELEECDKPLKEDEEVDQSTMLNTIYNYYKDYMSDLAFIEDFVNCIDDYEGFVKFAESATQNDGIGNSAPDDILSEILDAYDDISMFFDDSLSFLDYNKVKEWYDSLEINESTLNEKYSEKLGGDSEDFVNDVNVIKSALEAIDTDSFGAKLSQQMVWDWIETCDYQIERGNRLTKGEFNESTLNEADGWIAFYNGNKVEITKDEAHDLWSAKQVAIKKLNVPKSKVSLVAVEPAYNESEKKPIVEAAETEVKDLQVIKEQGNVYMLEDKSEGTRYIVGENYNLSEGEIENAEIYESKEEADKDYLNRCEITTTDKPAE